MLIRLYEIFQWNRHRPTKTAVHPFRYKSVTPDKHRSWINAASNQRRRFVAWTIDQLVSGGMQRNQTDACLKERYWRLTRLWRSVMLHCADWMAGSSLLMLLWTPSRHFEHLLSPVVKKRKTWCNIPITSAIAIIKTYGVNIPESDIRCIVYRTSTQPTSNGDTHVVRPERMLGDGHEEL